MKHSIAVCYVSKDMKNSLITNKWESDGDKLSCEFSVLLLKNIETEVEKRHLNLRFTRFIK